MSYRCLHAPISGYSRVLCINCPCRGGLKYPSRSADMCHQCPLNTAITRVRFPYSGVSEVTLPVSGRVAQSTSQF